MAFSLKRFFYVENHYVIITKAIAVFNIFATRSRTNDSEGDYKMKIQNVTKLTLAAMIAVQLLNVEVASAKLPKKFIQTFKTSKIEALEDPYYQVKSVKIRELTNEEALEFNSEDRKLSVVSKAFNGPGIPNIPPVPPSGGGSVGELSATTGNGTGPSTRGALDSIIMVIFMCT